VEVSTKLILMELSTTKDVLTSISVEEYIYQCNKGASMPKLTVLMVECRRESDSGSECEIYLKGNGAKVWPDGDYQSIKEDEVIEINWSTTYSTNYRVELWEQDSSSPDDYIGGFTVNDDSEGEVTAKMNGDGNSFDLYYKVEPS
jgi:hypothetical protein